MKNTLLFLIMLAGVGTLTAQTPVWQTFKDRRVINSHSTETLPKRKLDARIVHRFGDIAGDQGGYSSFYGLETAEDVLFGVEYGITDQLMVGLARAKGGGTMPDGTQGLNQLLNLTVKYKVLNQTEGNEFPVSVAILGVGSMSTAEKVESADVLQSFEQFAHRIAYHGQLIVARKFSSNFSLQLSGGYTYRNLVPFEDENGIVSLGAATRIQLSKVYGLILDSTFPLGANRTGDAGFYPAVGIGLEIDTGGHVFQVNLTNATQIMETDYIPYSTASWGEGQFRLGFTISRLFNL